jgi:hypothetical protein
VFHDVGFKRITPPGWNVTIVTAVVAHVSRIDETRTPCAGTWHIIGFNVGVIGDQNGGASMPSTHS